MSSNRFNYLSDVISFFFIKSPAVVLFGINDLSTDVNYNPVAVGFILNMLLWFVPTCSIFFLATYILYKLRILSKKKKKKIKHAASTMMAHSTLDNDKFMRSHNVSKKLTHFVKSIRLNAQTKFSIIIFSYLAQWMPPCFLANINGLCSNCITGPVYNGFYWLTYTVCLVDPIVVLLINTNVACFGRKKN